MSAIQMEGLSELMNAMRLTEEELLRIRRPWQYALIIHLLGKKLFFMNLRQAQETVEVTIGHQRIRIVSGLFHNKVLISFRLFSSPCGWFLVHARSLYGGTKMGAKL